MKKNKMSHIIKLQSPFAFKNLRNIAMYIKPYRFWKFLSDPLTLSIRNTERAEPRCPSIYLSLKR